MDNEKNTQYLFIYKAIKVAANILVDTVELFDCKDCSISVFILDFQI